MFETVKKNKVAFLPSRRCKTLVSNVKIQIQKTMPTKISIADAGAHYYEVKVALVWAPLRWRLLANLSG